MLINSAYISDTDSEEEKEVIKESSDSDSYEEELIDERKDGETLVELTTQEMSTPQPQPRRKRFIPKYDVDGVYQVTLGDETQMQIEIVIGTHVNAQYPWKFVSKAKVIEAIEVGGELSEFFPLKKKIEDYDDDLILMGYIVNESKDIDEFYVCCTKEARDHCKQQSDKFIRRQEKKLEKSVQRKPRPWKSLGSELEIIEQFPVNTRSLVQLEIKVKFPTVYQPKKFHVREAGSIRDGYIELTPYRQKFNNIFRRRIDTASQAVPPRVSQEAQTVLRYPKNMWTQSIADALGGIEDTEAGGDNAEKGKKEIETNLELDEEDHEEEESLKKPVDDVSLAAYKAAYKRLRRTSYIKMINNFITNNKNEMNSIIELNTVMDIYCNDYSNLVASKSVGIYDSMAFEEYVCFTDVRGKDKYVSCAEFHPMWSGIVAMCYSDGSPTVMKNLSSRPDPIQRAVYGLNPVMIWSHIDSLIPKLYLNSPREVKTLSFCPFEENILIGGCVNGQIILWDITNKLENVENIEVLSETREKYRIAMNAHMGWMKNVQDKAIVQATALSNLITSHYGPITAIKWWSPNFVITPTGKPEKVPPKTRSLMFLTGSEDGTILVWSLSTENITQFEGKKVKKSKRVLKRPSGLLVDISPYKVLDRILQPCYKIILGVAGHPQTLSVQSLGIFDPVIRYIYTPKNEGTGRKYFVCEIVPQKESDLQLSSVIYCGSQHGEVRRVTWEGHAFNTGELVNSEYCDAKFSCRIHDGIVSCTKKNPFLPQITVTVGGKVFAIWSDKLLDRPLTWKKRSSRLTDAAWSLYKSSILFISTSEGTLETWDLLLRSDQPVAVQTLSGTQLTGVTLHTLPLVKNIIGVSDVNGSFRMFLVPPIFMIENPTYKIRLESMVARELKVMQSFIVWQDKWMKNNPQILLEIKRKEGALLLEKEEEKRKQKEEEEKRLEQEAEARREAKQKVIGPEERWQMIVQKLIERTIAVKKRINRAELIEHEKPLRELEAQRLEKEKRMLDIMKNQKTIFNDTVAILFPEAVKKPPKQKKSLLVGDKSSLKKEYLEDYNYLKNQAFKTIAENPYKVSFSWDSTLHEGKERRQALSAHENFIRMHKCRLEEDFKDEEPLKPLERRLDPEGQIETTVEEDYDKDTSQ